VAVCLRSPRLTDAQQVRHSLTYQNFALSGVFSWLTTYNWYYDAMIIAALIVLTLQFEGGE
jgi:hypothetical protein